MRTHSLADLQSPLRAPVRALDSIGSPDSITLHYSALWLHQLANLLERKMRGLDRLFWHRVRMARFGPDVHFAISRELDDPFRVGKAVILHLEPFTRGVAIGWYRNTGLSESEALRRAVSLRDPTQQELDDLDEDKLHGPGKQRSGLRFSATGGSPVRDDRPRLRVVAADDAGAQ
jgi:hypothetical protein